MAAPPRQLRSSSQAQAQPEGQPLGTLPHRHPKLQQEASLCGAGGQHGSPPGWLRRLPGHTAPAGLGLTCRSGPGTTAGTATGLPSLPLALRQPVFPSPGSPPVSLQAVPSCAGCPGVPQAVPVPRCPTGSAQLCRVPRCPTGSAQLCGVPRCPPGSAQLLSADVGPRPGNRTERQASSPCTAAAAGGQAALRAHSPFIHGKK